MTRRSFFKKYMICTALLIAAFAVLGVAPAFSTAASAYESEVKGRLGIAPSSPGCAYTLRAPEDPEPGKAFTVTVTAKPDASAGKIAMFAFLLRFDEDKLEYASGFNSDNSLKIDNDLPGAWENLSIVEDGNLSVSFVNAISEGACVSAPDKVEFRMSFVRKTDSGQAALWIRHQDASVVGWDLAEHHATGSYAVVGRADTDSSSEDAGSSSEDPGDSSSSGAESAPDSEDLSGDDSGGLPSDDSGSAGDEPSDASGDDSDAVSLPAGESSMESSGNQDESDPGDSPDNDDSSSESSRMTGESSEASSDRSRTENSKEDRPDSKDGAESSGAQSGPGTASSAEPVSSVSAPQSQPPRPVETSLVYESSSEKTSSAPEPFSYPEEQLPQGGLPAVLRFLLIFIGLSAAAGAVVALVIGFVKKRRTPME